MDAIENYKKRIKPLHEAAILEAALHLDQLTKPLGSLGKLEVIAKQVAGITGEKIPDLSRKAVIVMAGDHGVCAEGISAFPAEVTPQMVMNFLHGGAAVNVLARHAGADVVCVDIGVNADLAHPQLISRKVRKGTNNIAHGPAMTREEALQAIAVGWELVEELFGKGVRLFATGEMGIGNTTSSAAMLIVLAGIDVQQAVGRGTGIDEMRWLHKQEVVIRAIAVNQADASDPLDVLSKLGGLEIAGLVGVILGAAAHGCPVIIDGFISSAAALVASRMAPLCVDYLLGSHLSLEQGHAAMLESIGLAPMLQMDMRLGEGTGAVLAFHFVDAALKIMSEMATFTSAGVSNA
ncbi:MAG: nicotinate-nucleotide--dimethylbenzimidazole phosphoribosyltransferase [Paenibacillaceae bacterium]